MQQSNSLVLPQTKDYWALVPAICNRLRPHSGSKVIDALRRTLLLVDQARVNMAEENDPITVEILLMRPLLNKVSLGWLNNDQNC